MSAKLNQIEYQSNHLTPTNSNDIEVSKNYSSTSYSANNKSNDNIWILRDDFVNNNKTKSIVKKNSPQLKQQASQPTTSCLKLSSSKNKNQKSNKSVTYAPFLSQGKPYFIYKALYKHQVYIYIYN